MGMSPTASRKVRVLDVQKDFVLTLGFFALLAGSIRSILRG